MLFYAAGPLVPGNGGADMVRASFKWEPGGNLTDATTTASVALGNSTRRSAKSFAASFCF
jgi:hypothetical protein